jgi:N-methylhydantoinase A/oxoprolinase/acetone carboxylase beta subunit
MHARIGIDIGGTFTDFVFMDEASQTMRVEKVLTTPHDPSVAVITGTGSVMSATTATWSDIAMVNHATTLVTNAVIERKGVATGLLTTRGFRDILTIGTERRYDIYDILLDLPAPLIPRYLTEEIDERVLPDGSVHRPLDRNQARCAIERLLSLGVESIAVCLLHSYVNPAHEQELRSLIGDLAPDVSVSISSDILPEIREYPRASTTAVNAYVQPTVRRYIERLQGELGTEESRPRFYLMQSNGGACDAAAAIAQPVHLLESGPAAGALAAAFFGSLAGVDDLLSFDMGGTTAKLCLVEGGAPLKANFTEAARMHRFKPGSGLPVKIPVVELIEIGAGGGSIASLDALGLLKVGPESAGADPGPACYGRGGSDPTVSDADLVLGYLDAGFFLGGDMTLFTEQAATAIESHVGTPAGISTIEAAAGIHRVVNEQMALAAKMHIIEKGQDPRRYAMVAFGGAGPVHAYGVAESLKLSRIVYPSSAGIASAIGLLIAPIAFDLMRTLKVRLDEAQPEALQQVIDELEAEGKRLLGEAGVPEEAATFTRSADMRYKGQGYEIEVSFPDGDLAGDSRAAIQHEFDTAYQKLYGRLTPHVPVEFVTLRVVASGPRPEFPLQPRVASGDGAHVALKGTRKAWFSNAGGFLECAVYDRYTLPAGSEFLGPAIVEERESTAVIGAGARCQIDLWGNLIVDLPDQSAAASNGKE